MDNNLGFDVTIKWEYDLCCKNSWCRSHRIERQHTEDGEVILTCLACGNTIRQEADHG